MEIIDEEEKRKKNMKKEEIKEREEGEMES